MINKYWAGIPKTDEKLLNKNKHRQFSEGSKAPPAKRVNGRGKGKQVEPSPSPEELDWDKSHLDDVEKYKDVEDWEELVASVDTVERTDKGLTVFLTM